MPAIGLRQEFKMKTRNLYTEVECELGIRINGKELPNMAVVGGALEEAIELVKQRISESYKAVPPRTDTPIAEPYKQVT